MALEKKDQKEYITRSEIESVLEGFQVPKGLAGISVNLRQYDNNNFFNLMYREGNIAPALTVLFRDETTYRVVSCNDDGLIYRVDGVDHVLPLTRTEISNLLTPVGARLERDPLRSRYGIPVSNMVLGNDGKLDWTTRDYNEVARDHSREK